MNTNGAVVKRPYEIVVWGATGFTGKLVCRHIAENYQGSVSWAMAGRDEKKLQKVKESITEINSECSQVPIITAQLNDRASLDAMITQTKVLISTVGPFMRMGTPIVESCIRNQTHYCDTTGETPWVKQIINKYHKEAQNANTRIVVCCGFDSIPFDLGVYFVAQHARKQYNTGLKQAQVLWGKCNGGASGGTIDSAMGMMTKMDFQDKKQFMTDGYYLLSPELRENKSKKASQLILSYLPEAQSYAATSVMGLVNSQITYRSNALLGFRYGENFEYVEGIQMSSYLTGSLYLAGLGAFFSSLTAPGVGWFVRKYLLPAAGNGPSWEAMNNGYYNIRVVGVLEGEKNQKQKIIEATVSDPKRDPGYWGTSRNVLESALCLAQQQQELESEGFPKGGILTPASAMGHLLIQRLQKANILFTMSKL